MIIRTAKREDLVRLQPLYERESERLARLCPDHYLKSGQDAPLFQAITEHKNSDILIAEREDGEICASLLLWQTETPLYPCRKSRRFTYICDFLCADEKWDSTLGLLLEKAAEWSRARESEYIEADIPTADTELSRLLSEYGFSPLMSAFTLAVDGVSPKGESGFCNLTKAMNGDEKYGECSYFSPSVLENE